MIRAYTRTPTGEIIEGQPIHFDAPILAEAWYWRQVGHRPTVPATAVLDPGRGRAVAPARYRLDAGHLGGPREQEPERFAMLWATPEQGWTPPGPVALRGLLAAAGWSQLQAGRLLGVSGRAVRKWCAGDAPLTFPVWYTLREMHLRGEAR